MNKKNKIFITIFIIGAFAILNGAYLKINANPNANITLSTGLTMELISVLGLFFNNINKLKAFFK